MTNYELRMKRPRVPSRIRHSSFFIRHSFLIAPLLVAMISLSALAQTNISSIVGPPRSKPLIGAALEKATKETTSLLRCPVCQGLSIADSPASMAVKMKEQVRDFHAAGYDREQVMTYFERSYGEFVRLDPPRRGINWLVWIAPLAGLAIGATALWFAMKSMRSRKAPDAPLFDPELEPYVDRVRALVYGTKPPEVP